MNPIISNFLKDHRICVISVNLGDGNLHSATVHYSHTENPFKIFIQTTNDTLKASPFLNGKTGKGAMVIGFSEEEWMTLQLHGDIRIISDADEIEEAAKIHYQKLPNAEKRRGPDTVFLEFTPTWWRYTDFNTKPEETIITS